MLDKHYLLPQPKPVHHSRDLTKGVLTANEVAEIFRVHPTTIYRLIHEGTFPIAHFMIGADYRFVEEEVRRWLTQASEQSMDEARLKRRVALSRRIAARKKLQGEGFAGAAK